MNPGAVATGASGTVASAPPRVRSRFHVWLALWMLAIVVIGFWLTYFSPIFRGTLAIPTIVHAHGLVFLGWLSPIFIGMVHDWIMRRRIHPVYTIGSIALFLFAVRLIAACSEPWLRIGRPIIDALR